MGIPQWALPDSEARKLWKSHLEDRLDVAGRLNEIRKLEEVYERTQTRYLHARHRLLSVIDIDKFDMQDICQEYLQAIDARDKSKYNLDNAQTNYEQYSIRAKERTRQFALQVCFNNKTDN